MNTCLQTDQGISPYGFHIPGLYEFMSHYYQENTPDHTLRLINFYNKLKEIHRLVEKDEDTLQFERSCIDEAIRDILSTTYYKLLYSEKDFFEPDPYSPEEVREKVLEMYQHYKEFLPDCEIRSNERMNDIVSMFFKFSCISHESVESNNILVAQNLMKSARS